MVAALISFSVTLVAERMASPSYWPDYLGELFLVLAEIGQIVDLDAAVLEYLHGGGGEFV